MTLDPRAFLDRLFAALTADGVDVNGSELDHLCYRVASAERYDALKKDLADRGGLLSETLIGGRPIASFLLHRPMRYHDRLIAVIELPAPKPGSPYPEGFEHAEFVVGEDPRMFARRYPQLTWDLSDADKPINAVVRLRYEGFSVRFHRHALAHVIAHLDPR
ncbi:MAG: VOC family protein [Flavobacteriales bacterium]